MEEWNLQSLSFMSVSLIELVESFIVVVMKIQVIFFFWGGKRKIVSLHTMKVSRGSGRYKFTHS
jgi:hypothetical protein